MGRTGENSTHDLPRRPAHGRRLLLGRLRGGLWTGLAFTVLFGLADLRVYPEHVPNFVAYKIAFAALLVGSLLFFATRPGRRAAIRVALLDVTAALFMTAVGGVPVGDDGSTVLLATVLILLFATLVPWGLTEQLILIAAGTAATTLNLFLVNDTLRVDNPYRFVGVVTIWVWSLYLLRELSRRRLADAYQERARRRAERAEKREATVARALAHVGERLIATLNTPDLLRSLCRTSVEALGCDFAHTWLWNTGEDAIVPVAGFGDPPEIWETIRSARLPRESAVQGPIARLLTSGDVGQAVFGGADDDPPPPGVAPVIHGVTVLLCVGLRRGSELIGAQITGVRGRRTPFNKEQRRILHGIGNLASMALEYTLAQRQLEAANRLKADFVANMSHELRTPINVIRGYTDLAIEGEFGVLNPELKDTLQRIDERAAALQHLVDDTLDLAGLDTGSLSVQQSDIDLHKLIAEIVTESRPHDTGNVAFDIRIEADAACLRADATKLKVVLRNLLSNAFKFTADGKVEFTAQRRGGGIQFGIRDTGTGIPAALHEAIFEPFRQGDGSMTREYGGTGLGLHVSRRLLDVMGGTIELESKVGCGSLFQVWIPAAPAAGGKA